MLRIRKKKCFFFHWNSCYHDITRRLSEQTIRCQKISNAHLVLLPLSLCFDFKLEPFFGYLLIIWKTQLRATKRWSILENSYLKVFGLSLRSS